MATTSYSCYIQEQKNITFISHKEQERSVKITQPLFNGTANKPHTEQSLALFKTCKDKDFTDLSVLFSFAASVSLHHCLTHSTAVLLKGMREGGDGESADAGFF